ncbi:hypothetical protein SDC9_211688 [bioreactor metagenome]|uniref:Uncharacterized protein n=1 Tax=bioreactor metagenome TaxID=1076179 RepID=A0A645JK05_9ZZZZ
MNDIGIFKSPDDMDNGFDFTDMGQELVAQTFAFGSTFYQTGNIIELNRCFNFLFGMIHLGQAVQPLVRHRDDTDIGLNGAEGIIS